MKCTIFSFFAVLALQVSAAAVVDRGVSHQLEARTCSNPTSAIPVYRAFNAQHSDHFYTTNLAEFQTVVNGGTYISEGAPFKIFSTPGFDTVPFYRLYNPELYDHFYTTNAAERDFAVNTLNYVYESVIGHVYPNTNCGGIPLHRLYNVQLSDHVYTTTAQEVEYAKANGWNYEGVAAYIIPA
ncbi:hypothetical protein DXG03_004235 [Asterophora parasitica]|uniref:DUF5648 domain-containing protein n=1 Tax=Asterophora parasitica TaxID=117018 RepID=A0A9P7GFS3_9AGAR|nr:hypothetical protein DXG03_004235 [Asterophora parasitica]